MLERLKNEPAVVIGALFAIVLAAVQAAGGRDLLGPDIVSAITGALDPNTGWALPLIVGIITRFFVSPARKA